MFRHASKTQDDRAANRDVVFLVDSSKKRLWFCSYGTESVNQIRADSGIRPRLELRPDSLRVVELQQQCGGMCFAPRKFVLAELRAVLWYRLV